MVLGHTGGQPDRWGEVWALKVRYIGTLTEEDEEGDTTSTSTKNM